MSWDAQWKEDGKQPLIKQAGKPGNSARGISHGCGNFPHIFAADFQLHWIYMHVNFFLWLHGHDPLTTSLASNTTVPVHRVLLTSVDQCFDFGSLPQRGTHAKVVTTLRLYLLGREGRGVHLRASLPHRLAKKCGLGWRNFHSCVQGDVYWPGLHSCC